MRYAIVSDIHANFPAWKTVLTDIADMKADKIICLGDVVGYGSQPVAVLESVYHVVNVTLMGNHDAAVCGKLDPDTFSPRAKDAVLRHREQLAQPGIDWLSRLPLMLTAPGFRCAHGDFSDPAAFHYIIKPEHALPSWQATGEQLLFVGHSHMPGIYVVGASGKPHFIEPCDFQLEDGKRYIVNPGSVGYPRVGDCRSSYCLYDDATQTLVFRQLPFDDDLYRQSLRDAGLEDDPWLSRQASRRFLPRVREQLSFAKPSPAKPSPQNPGSSAPDRFRTPRKRLFALATLILFVVAIASLVAFTAGRTASAHPAPAISVPEFDLPAVAAYPLVPPDKNLLPTLPATLNPDGRLAGWRYAFEDRNKQAFGTGLRDASVTLCIRNTGTCRMALESPCIALAGTSLPALRLRGRIYKPEPFSGTVFCQLLTYTSDPDGSLKQGRGESYELRTAKRKSTTPSADRDVRIRLAKNVTHVRFRIEAAFDGTLEIAQPYLAGDIKGEPK